MFRILIGGFLLLHIKRRLFYWIRESKKIKKIAWEWVLSTKIIYDNTTEVVFNNFWHAYCLLKKIHYICNYFILNENLIKKKFVLFFKIFVKMPQIRFSYTIIKIWTQIIILEIIIVYPTAYFEWCTYIVIHM